MSMNAVANQGCEADAASLWVEGTLVVPSGMLSVKSEACCIEEEGILAEGGELITVGGGSASSFLGVQLQDENCFECQWQEGKVLEVVEEQQPFERIWSGS